MNSANVSAVFMVQTSLHCQGWSCHRLLIVQKILPHSVLWCLFHHSNQRFPKSFSCVSFLISKTASFIFMQKMATVTMIKARTNLKWMRLFCLALTAHPVSSPQQIHVYDTVGQNREKATHALLEKWTWATVRRAVGIGTKWGNNGEERSYNMCDLEMGQIYQAGYLW